MYKKLLLSFVLIGILFFGLSKANVGNVYMRYCEDIASKTWFSSNKTILLEGGTKKELCFYFYTDSVEPVYIQYGFYEGTLDPSWLQNCEVKSPNKISSFFMEPELTGRLFSVSSDKPKKVKETVLAPVWISWMQLWCIAYFIVDPPKEMEEWQMFSVLIRKAIPLNMFIWSSTSIQNSISLLKNSWKIYSTDNKVKITVNSDDTLSLGFLVKNDGNITQNVNISGKLYNFFWFEKSFDFQQKIGPWETKELWESLWMIPSYKWFFTVKYAVKNDPSFNFEIVWLEDKYKIWSFASYKAQIYVFSWITLIAVVLAIFIIIRAFRPRRRMDPIQQAPQIQPQSIQPPQPQIQS